MAKCYFCGKEITTQEKIFRSSVCPHCGKDIKICCNCSFFSPGSQWDCRETISEPVREKDRANFCDYFSFSGGSSTKTAKESEKARSRFNSLFQDE